MARPFDFSRIEQIKSRLSHHPVKQFTIALGKNDLTQKFEFWCNEFEWTFTQACQGMIEHFLIDKNITFDESVATKLPNTRPNQKKRRLGRKCSGVITCSLEYSTAKAFVEYCDRNKTTFSAAGREMLKYCIDILENDLKELKED